MKNPKLRTRTNPYLGLSTSYTTIRHSHPRHGNKGGAPSLQLVRSGPRPVDIKRSERATNKSNKAILSSMEYFQ